MELNLPVRLGLIVDLWEQFGQKLMGRWKRFGIIVILYAADHWPRHVHVFEDGKRPLKFDIESWTIVEGRLTARARRALEALREEGVFEESEV
jgi:hypothetical protein